MVPKPSAGLHACATPASHATERKMNASSIVKPCWSTRSLAASSETSCERVGVVGRRRVRHPAVVELGHRPGRLLAVEHVEADVDLAGDLDAGEADLTVAHGGVHVADREQPAGLPHGEEDPRAVAVQVVVEIAAVLPGHPGRQRLAPGRAPTTPTIGLAGNDTRSFICTIPSPTSNIRVTGACTSPLNCPNPGISVATPHGIGGTSRISATSESPGSAPLTATGPVAR